MALSVLIPIFFIFTKLSAFDVNGPINLKDEKLQPCIEKSGYQLDEDEPFDIKETPTIELLCLMKCVAETLKIIDSDGQIVQDNLDNFETDLPENKNTMFKDCATKSPEVKSCQDMDYFMQCLASV
ncbi:uncharacterized protein [Tenebrio molitor]|uniref:uncharacterized protein n=1 Tax=Tenebrio molitor TaxID=7067 RepID=UPI0036246DD9